MGSIKDFKLHTISEEIKEQRESKEAAIQNIGEKVCYTIFGKHQGLERDSQPIIVSDETDQLCYAYKLLTVHGWRYFIKTNSRGRFFNPWDIFGGTFNSNKKGREGRQEYLFKRVTDICFAYYLSFLRTKNTASIINAEREREV